ncbi:MAG TPA: hypothetical protein VK518_22795 [Puia sp.]|nr:hypothetical protein [Puia sp.]
MKKLFPILIILAILFLIVSFFIPAEQARTLSVQNTIQNTVAALHHPSRWRSLDSGKNTRITELGYMVYAITEPKDNGDSTGFSMAITPDLSPNHNPNIAAISYFHSTSLFYKLFPFLEKITFDARTVRELRSYLEDNTRFYGYPITTQKLVDSFFLTKKQDLLSRDLFRTLPSMFKELEDYARTNSCHVIAQNISFFPLGHDSVSLMAGLNIDKSIEGDKIYNFRQLPSTIGLVVGRYEGRFGLRTGIYTAIERFISDHALAKVGLPYERYHSALPVSDSSIIKIDLIYPVTYR